MQSLLSLNEALFGGGVANLATPVTLCIDAVVVVAFARTAIQPCVGQRRFTLLYALAVLVGSVISPYFFMYDCVILCLPALVFLDGAPRDRAVRLSIAAAYLLTWTAPLRYFTFGHLPWPLPVIAAPWTVVPLIALSWAGRRSCREVTGE
jgi:uncharacterized membrane protein YfcA